MKAKEATQSAITTASPKRWGGLIHIIAWGMFLGFPFLFTGRDSTVIPLSKYMHFLVTICSFTLLFYVNYLYLVKRFLFAKQTYRFLLVNTVLILGLLAAVYYVQGLIPIPPEGGRPPHEYDPSIMEHIGFVLAFFSIYCLIAALAVSFRMTGNWYTMEAERKELERSRSEAELQNLKSQLNPHFLFNTLNNIYSLIAFSPEKAQEAVHELSRMLRYVMYESNQPLVPLGKDLDFVRNYVELMRIRLPQHVELKTDIGCLSPGTLVAPLLFISLIENAFKHGVSNNKPSFIHIHIGQEGDRVECTILNSDFHKDSEQDKSGSGIGLVNLRRRLSLLYPDHYTYECGPEEGNYRSYLSIHVNETAL